MSTPPSDSQPDHVAPSHHRCHIASFGAAHEHVDPVRAPRDRGRCTDDATTERLPSRPRPAVPPLVDERADGERPNTSSRFVLQADTVGAEARLPPRFSHPFQRLRPTSCGAGCRRRRSRTRRCGCCPTTPRPVRWRVTRSTGFDRFSHVPDQDPPSHQLWANDPEASVAKTSSRVRCPRGRCGRGATVPPSAFQPLHDTVGPMASWKAAYAGLGVRSRCMQAEVVAQDRRVAAAVAETEQHERSGEVLERGVPSREVVVHPLRLLRLGHRARRGTRRRAGLGAPHLLRAVAVGDHHVVDGPGLRERVPVVRVERVRRERVRVVRDAVEVSAGPARRTGPRARWPAGSRCRPRRRARVRYRR